MSVFTMPGRKAWLENLQVGDEVACYSNRYGSRENYRIMKVTKITPTRMIITDNKERWNKDGELRSGGTLFMLVPVTDHIREMVERDKMLYQIKETEFSKLSTSALRDILNVINGRITAGSRQESIQLGGR